MQKTKPVILSIVVIAVIISSVITAMAFEGNRTGILLQNIDIAPKDVSLKISLSKNKVVSKVGRKFNLGAEATSDGYKVKFRSTNKNIATVSRGGKVALIGKGKVNIIAECNGVKSVCNITVKPKNIKVKNEEMPRLVYQSLSDENMGRISSTVGKQTDYAYPSSTIMCSAYAYAYAYYQVTGQYRAPGTFWSAGGCTWNGGTVAHYGSPASMLGAIKSSIDSGKACVGLIAYGNSSHHYVTFYGYNGNGSSLSDFKTIDPWDGRSKMGSSYRYCGQGYHVITVNG
ncbi:MAG: hypothetical protein IIU14_04080 [Ruminococcus sp.]|nr:hypothetical protein [Ruminococcus sp.]